VLKKFFLGSIAVVLGVGDQVAAADMPRPVVSPYTWTGLYVGGHFGYGSGSFGPGTHPVPSEALIFPKSLTGFVGGYQAGYNFQAANNVVYGFETDVTFISPRDHASPIPSPFETSFNLFGTARARVGYASGRWLPYATGGLAWAKTKVTQHDPDGVAQLTQSANHWGWTVGAGVEYALTGNWTAKVEYNFIDLGSTTYSLQTSPASSVAVDPKIHLVKLGLNYRISDAWPSSASSMAVKQTSVPEADAWSIHGQTTAIVQGYGRFRSPYQGQFSLPGKGETRETWTTTMFIGRRLWDGGEVYFNPELAQGSGIGTTLGIAGFSNGEAQKAGAPYPRIRAQRYFFRQTFGLGGEQETVEDGINQLAGKRDIDRVTLTIGRFAVGDYFDANSYAHDPRVDFLNWSMWSAVAYDFPADLPGFTRGAVAELNRKDWALRAGVFQVPTAPSSDNLKFNTGGAVVEFEDRYALFGQPGKFRIGAFINRGQTANYREALAAAAADPSIDINAVALDLRRARNKDGFYANVEQAINKDVGAFGRVSWNDGKNEILSFTDVDRSVSGGVAVKGRSWGRAGDTFGLGGAVNGLSSAHRDFLAAGGLGLIIGDGALNYRTERLVETYYAIGLTPLTTLTFDYQFVANPAYNADRGPVSIFSARLHAEF
jgi:high affinity Mn2+ porin